MKRKDRKYVQTIVAKSQKATISTLTEYVDARLGSQVVQAVPSFAHRTGNLRFEAVSEVDTERDFVGNVDLSIIFQDCGSVDLVKFGLSLNDARRLLKGLTASIERYDDLSGRNPKAE